MKKVSKQSAKFLSFNNTNIYFIDVNGVNWIALKPICTILNIPYTRQLETIKKHQILGRAYTLQYMHDTTNRLQKMSCLPEKFIYGWIFSIQSNSEELKKYQQECYEILYNHFHGTITKRKESLELKADLVIKKNEILEKLQEQEIYKDYLNIKKELSLVNSTLSKQDNQIIENKIKSLFEQDFLKN